MKSIARHCDQKKGESVFQKRAREARAGCCCGPGRGPRTGRELEAIARDRTAVVGRRGGGK